MLFPLVCLLGCRVAGEDYERPELDVPRAFSNAAAEGASPDGVGAWWDAFEDATLQGLVADALEGNVDLRIALVRIREARAARGIVEADLVPTIDVTGSYQRTGQSREVVFGDFAPRAFDTFTTGLEARWELDLWGRLRRAVEAASADIQVSVEDARALLVSVLAETALAYVDLRRFERQEAIALDNLALQQQTVQLTERQFEANLVSQLDVAQARSQQEGTRSAIPILRAGAQRARHRLAVLTGRNPGELVGLGGAEAIGQIPAAVLGAVAPPSELLRRRPDLRAAERALAAQTARVGVSEGLLYPTLELTGSLGYSALELDDLPDNQARFFGYGPAVRWNLFDRKRLRSAVAVEDTRVEQALAAYELTLLLALEDVENALVDHRENRARREALTLAVEEARRAVQLSRERYRQGLVAFQSVLDTQRGLFQLEAELADTEAAISSALIGLYRALGGGWEERDVMLLPEDGTDSDSLDPAAP